MSKAAGDTPSWRPTEEMRSWMLDRVAKVLRAPSMFATGASAMSVLWWVLLQDLTHLENRDDDLRDRVQESNRRFGTPGIGALDQWFAGGPSPPTAEAASAWAEVAWRLGYVALDRTLEAAEWQAIGLASPDVWPGRALLRSDLVRDHPPSLMVGRTVFCYVLAEGTWAFVDFDGTPPWAEDKRARDARLPATPLRDGLVFV